jgi:hypothetical protein
MDQAQALQYAMSALGACIVCIAWWIGNELKEFNQLARKLLVKLENHDARISRLEEKSKET